MLFVIENRNNIKYNSEDIICVCIKKLEKMVLMKLYNYLLYYYIKQLILIFIIFIDLMTLFVYNVVFLTLSWTFDLPFEAFYPLFNFLSSDLPPSNLLSSDFLLTNLLPFDLPPSFQSLPPSF